LVGWAHIQTHTHTHHRHTHAHTHTSQTHTCTHTHITDTHMHTHTHTSTHTRAGAAISEWSGQLALLQDNFRILVLRDGFWYVLEANDALPKWT